LVADGIGGPGTYQENVSVWAGIGLVLGGVLTLLVGRWDENRYQHTLVDPQTGHENRYQHALVDPQTGHELTVATPSSLFFVPL
jgi:hypothetical protein